MQAQHSQLRPPAQRLQCTLHYPHDILLCILHLSRVTLVHIDGADALGTIGQHLARVAKRAGDKCSGAGDAAVRSLVYVTW